MTDLYREATIPEIEEILTILETANHHVVNDVWDWVHRDEPWFTEFTDNTGLIKHMREHKDEIF